MSGTTQKNRQKILKIQKKAIRIMTNSTYNAHTNPLFKTHKILPTTCLLSKHNSPLCTLLNIIWHHHPFLTLGKEIMYVRISLILETPTNFTCHSLELRPLKNLHFILSQPLGTHCHHILSYKQTKSHSNGPSRPICLKNCLMSKLLVRWEHRAKPP